MTPEAIFTFLNDIKTLEFEEDNTIRRISDSDSRSVKIMTIHSSKGLEFDVVFALGLIERTPEPERLVPNNRRLEPVLTKEDPRYRLYCAEQDAEKMRQLYVAMTRAKRRLYLPVIDGPDLTPPLPGIASPMELYLQKGSIPSHPHITTLTLTPMTPTPLHTLQERTPVPPKAITIPGAPRTIQSFTSIASSTAVPDLSPPHDFLNPIQTIHTLPAGSETGTLLHSLLERAPFSRDQPPISLPEKYLPWKAAIEQCIHNALTLPLDTFCLADIKSCYRECEFLYPTPQGYMKGVIDLAFTHNNKAYLLDWKSNWLGADSAAYTQESLRTAIAHHQYDLQASIYREAFGRYLNLMNASEIAGVFYFFLRGNTYIRL